MRFHVLSLPHTQTTKDYVWCAYTAKVHKFCDMMTSLGHEVFLYGGTENEAKVTEHVTVVSSDDYQQWFSERNWANDVFDQWEPMAPCWLGMNTKVIDAISERKKPGDFMCLISGRCQEMIARAHPNLRPVEWGVGYEGIINEAFHVFESYAWMHYVYGVAKITDGRFFDTVIPNFYDENDFIVGEKKEDYLLYLGRPTQRKGLEVVAELAKLGHKILAAGQGYIDIPGVKHLGLVRGKKKAELLARAKAVLVPTRYIEPFGGVAVEAMLSGTPVITTDFGAFTETVEDKITGFRCHTLGDFHKAALNAERLLPSVIRRHAERYLMKNVRYEYEDYFKRVQLLNDLGWYSI